MGEKMSKANSNFDHLVRDKYGHKEIKGTYHTINKLEAIITNFMNNWGPEIQEARSRRDEVWDEMVRVVSIQNKHRDKNE